MIRGKKEDETVVLARVYAIAVFLLGAYAFIDGVRVLHHGGGTAGAVGVTNGLLSCIGGVLLVISGQIAWYSSRDRVRSKD
jgi:hypothetical protein